MRLSLCQPLGLIRPVREVRTLEVAFPRVAEIRLVVVIEVVVNLDVELLSFDALISAVCSSGVDSVVDCGSGPADLRYVESVTTLEIVRVRHFREEPLHEPGGIRELAAVVPESRVDAGAARENCRTARAVTRTKRRHLERIRIDLLIPEDTETHQPDAGVSRTIGVRCRG